MFQIGSLTKGFLATTMAIMVDRGKMKWSDTVVTPRRDCELWDRYERRAPNVDLLGQRSGLPPYANDMVGTLGGSEEEMIASLAHVEPDRKLWVDYSYVNIPQMEAARIVAMKAEVVPIRKLELERCSAEGAVRSPWHGE